MDFVKSTKTLTPFISKRKLSRSWIHLKLALQTLSRVQNSLNFCSTNMMKAGFAAAVLFVVLAALSRPVVGGISMRKKVPPCKKGEDWRTHYCEPRFFPCGSFALFDSFWPASYTFQKDNGPHCWEYSLDPHSRRGKWYIVQFDGEDGCMEIKMKAGECW